MNCCYVGRELTNCGKNCRRMKCRVSYENHETGEMSFRGKSGGREAREKIVCTHLEKNHNSEQVPQELVYGKPLMG